MPTYIILGAPRSGTSFLTAALVEQGVHMGDTFYQGPNPYGGYENQDFIDINKDIVIGADQLFGMGAVPVSEEALLASAEKHTGRIRQAIAKNRRDKWGWKDPRTTLLIRAYMPLILETDDDPFIYCCFRRPKYVAASIARCSRAAEDGVRGIEVAKEYDRRLLSFLTDFLEL